MARELARLEAMSTLGDTEVATLVKLVSALQDAKKASADLTLSQLKSLETDELQVVLEVLQAELTARSASQASKTEPGTTPAPKAPPKPRTAGQVQHAARLTALSIARKEARIRERAEPPQQQDEAETPEEASIFPPEPPRREHRPYLGPRQEAQQQQQQKPLTYHDDIEDHE
jgi:hypothetical protein